MPLVFSSPVPADAERVAQLLADEGMHPRVSGGLTSGLAPLLDQTISEVHVPDAEFERARRVLGDSKVLLDETVPHGEVPDGVCPVHEGPAVAVCDRCGTFLCAKCGSLGTPPLCEDCVARPDEPRQRPRWVVNVARVGVVYYLGLPLLMIVLALIARALRAH